MLIIQENETALCVAAGEGHGDTAPVTVGVRTVMEKRRFNK